MGILEKLRPLPRWKHADPAVRAASVYDLGPDEAEALLALAREDAEARVRRAAVTRLDDPAVLGDIARTDPDEDVRAEAIRGLAGLAAETEDAAHASAVVRQLVALGRMKEVVVIARDGTTAEVRAAIVDLLDDAKSLGSISRHAQDSATRLRALGRLTDPEEVLGVALKSEHTDAAVAALERISDPEALGAIAQRARNKVAARRARDQAPAARGGCASGAAGHRGPDEGRGSHARARDAAPRRRARCAYRIRMPRRPRSPRRAWRGPSSRPTLTRSIPS